MNASLNEKLRTVKWGEYKITQLFKPMTIKRKIKGEDVTEKGTYPAYSSDSENNGIVGYYNTPEFICDSKNPVYVVFGDHTRTMSIARNSFSVLDNVKVLRPYLDNTNVLLFVFSVWKKQIPNLGYKRHWGIAKECLLKLPAKDGKLDLDFMESFIAELEAERVAELTDYLTVSGLNYYELSSEEENALEKLKFVKWNAYKLTDVFTVKNTSNILARDIVESSGTVPYLCAGSENNAVSTYINYDEKYIEKGNCIFIGGKTFVVTYQEKDFYSNDSHNLALYLKEGVKSKATFLYMVTCVYKNLFQKYSWGNSISKSKIQSDIITLPITADGKIDFDFMELLISAIQKLVIKDVVLYADRKLEGTKEVIKH